MNRDILLKRLRAARSAQLQWITFTRALADNGPNSERNTVAADAAQKRFLQWYSQAIRALSMLPSFDLISSNHKALMELQDQIHEALSQEEGASSDHFLSWFRDPRKTNPDLHHLIGKAQRRSQRLIDGLDILEKELKTLPEAALKKIDSGDYVDNSKRFIIN